MSKEKIIKAWAIVNKKGNQIVTWRVDVGENEDFIMLEIYRFKKHAQGICFDQDEKVIPVEIKLCQKN